MRMDKKILIGLIVLLSAIFVGCSQTSEDINLPEPGDSESPIGGTVPANTSLQELCEGSGGKWLNEFYECEGIDQSYCQELGGEYNSCGSACRNDPNAEACTMQCVMYCAFNESDYEEEKELVACTREYMPVCGVDGQTYPNRCVAEKQNNVEIDYEGECVTVINDTGMGRDPIPNPEE